jgi:DNA-binding NtrC family response regulator
LNLNYQNIAVLEPDLDILNLYEISLHEFGYSFKGFTNTRSLLQYLDSNTQQIRFLLMEYKLDNITGCELADRIHLIDSNIKMAFVTGYSDIINNKLNIEIVMRPITLTRMIKLVKKYMEES